MMPKSRFTEKRDEAQNDWRHDKAPHTELLVISTSFYIVPYADVI